MMDESTVLKEEERDQELVARVVNGSAQEFRGLVLRHQSFIYNLVLRLVRDPQAAADITQDVFLRAYQGLKGFRGDSQFATWLARIALNLTNNYFASRGYRERMRSVELKDEHAASEDPGDEQRLTAMQQAIAELKPIYREPLVLCALERLTYEEAASILEIPVGTVRSRLNTARNQLRGLISKRLEGEVKEGER
jgi:RNA polymerase sigma-70 factor, ECF subfamily